jgi:hypothetical protein
VRGGFAFRFVRVPRIMRLVAGLSPWSPKLNSRLIHVGFVVNNIRLEQVFLREPRCFPSSIIPPVLHIYSILLPKLYSLSSLQLHSITHINISVWRLTLPTDVFRSLYQVLLACVGIVLRNGPWKVLCVLMAVLSVAVTFDIMTNIKNLCILPTEYILLSYES